MSVTINGSGTIGGLTAGGLPDGTVTAADLASTLDFTGKTVTLPAGVRGKILQVVQTTKGDIFSTTSTSFVDITGLSASITPSSSSSRILVMVSGAHGSGGAHSGFVRLTRDGTAIFVGDTASGYTSVSAGNSYGGSGDGNNNEMFTFSFVDSPATTSTRTYQLQLGAPQGGIIYVNTLGSNISGQAYSVRSPSSIILMEIAP